MYGYIFGPVRSRRLGISLGVANIPPRLCSYSCIYCQARAGEPRSVERRPYSDPARLLSEALKTAKPENVDYASIVPPGEPTLDSNLGELVDALRGAGYRVAVFTNATLLWRDDVLDDVTRADYISVKLDAAAPSTWIHVNRPHPALRFELLLEGLESLRRSTTGRVEAELMLVSGVNDSPGDCKLVARELRWVSKLWIAIPVRPPRLAWVRAPPPSRVLACAEEAASMLGYSRVGLLTEPEPEEYRVEGDPLEWLVRVTSVHPLPLDAARRLLGSAWSRVEEAIAEGRLRVEKFAGRLYLVAR